MLGLVLLVLSQTCSPGQPCQVQISCPAPTLSCPAPVCPVPVCPAPVIPPCPACPSQCAVADAGTPTPTPDAGTPVPDAGTPVPDAGTPVPTTTLPLKIQNNRVVNVFGAPVKLRGFNMGETRNCDKCTYDQPNVVGAKRRIDAAIAMGANFFRLLLEDYPTSGGRVSWQIPSRDATYLANLIEIVRYIGTKPGVYVVVSYWTGTLVDANEIPLQALCNEFENTLVPALGGLGNHVLFGITNEPHRNSSAANDTYTKNALEVCRAAIRRAETANSQPKHLVSISMPRNYGRYMGTWNESTWAHDDMVVLETHFYDPLDGDTNQNGEPTTWYKFQILDWVNRVPMYVGEFGPALGMTEPEALELASRLDALGVPWTAWMFHGACDPNMLSSSSVSVNCSASTLPLSSWGQSMKTYLLSNP